MGAKGRSLNLIDYTLDGLAELLKPNGFSTFHAGQIWDYLYRQQVRTVAEMVDLRPNLQAWLRENVTIDWPETAVSLTSSDSYTKKYLLRLADKQTIETVLMQFEGRAGDPRATACVSTQVGCAMGCVFCATGQMGFTRHLAPGEIVSQILYVDDVLQAQGQRLRNIVLMGMGEPLHNYENVMTAVAILTDHKGLSIAPKHITLSTVGVVPGIRRLADEASPIRQLARRDGCGTTSIGSARQTMAAGGINGCLSLLHQKAAATYLFRVDAHR